MHILVQEYISKLSTFVKTTTLFTYVEITSAKAQLQQQSAQGGLLRLQLK